VFHSIKIVSVVMHLIQGAERGLILTAIYVVTVTEIYNL